MENLKMITHEEYEKALGICKSYLLQLASIRLQIDNFYLEVDKELNHKPVKLKTNSELDFKKNNFLSSAEKLKVNRVAGYQGIRINTMNDLLKINLDDMVTYRGIGQKTISKLKLAIESLKSNDL